MYSLILVILLEGEENVINREGLFPHNVVMPNFNVTTSMRNFGCVVLKKGNYIFSKFPYVQIGSAGGVMIP